MAALWDGIQSFAMWGWSSCMQTPIAYAVFAENGNIRIWWSHPMAEHAKEYAQGQGMEIVPLYRRYGAAAVLDELLAFAAQKSGCDTADVEWASWSQIFPTTAGPRGAGGSSPTSYQVYAFRTPMGEPLMWCGGVWRRWSGQIGQRF